MLFEVAPHVFHWIELRRVGGKPLHHDSPTGSLHIILHQSASMNRGAIPDDGQVPGDMPLEMAEELDDLWSFDAAGVDLEVEAIQG